MGGNRLTIIRFASYDVLVRGNVEILTAPVCTMTDRNVTCTGSTVAGDPIIVTSSAADQANMTVSVGSQAVYQGPVQEVLDAGARPAP